MVGWRPRPDAPRPRETERREAFGLLRVRFALCRVAQSPTHATPIHRPRVGRGPPRAPTHTYKSPRTLASFSHMPLCRVCTTSPRTRLTHAHASTTPSRVATFC